MLLLLSISLLQLSRVSIGVESKPLMAKGCDNKNTQLMNLNSSPSSSIQKILAYLKQSSVIVLAQDIRVISDSLFNRFEPLRRHYNSKCPMIESTDSGKDDRNIPPWVKSVTCSNCPSNCVPMRFTVPFLRKSSNCLGIKGLCLKLIFKNITLTYYAPDP